MVAELNSLRGGPAARPPVSPTAQDEQIKKLYVEISKLQAKLFAEYAKNKQQVELSQLEDMQLKLQQAKEFIDYQSEQLAQSQAELAALNSTLAASPSNGAASTDSEGAESLQASAVAGELEELRSRLQQAKEYIDYQSEQLEAERTDAETARLAAEANLTELGKLRVQLQMAGESVDSVLRKSQILCVVSNLSGSATATTPAHYYVSTEAKLRAVEANLDTAAERWSAQAKELNDLREELLKTAAELSRVQTDAHKKQQECDELQMGNIYPSPSDDGRMGMYPLLSQSEDNSSMGPGLGFHHAEIMYGELESKLKAREADVASLNALLDSLNMSFQQKSKALDSSSAQLSCFRQVLTEAVDKVFEFRIKYLPGQGQGQADRQLLKAVGEEKQDLLRAMQQTVPSSSWISQQLLSSLQQAISSVEQDKASSLEALRRGPRRKRRSTRCCKILLKPR